MSTILIAGAGQLGSRYLQGLNSTANPHEIYVYDLAQSSLDTARSRYDEVSGSGPEHEVHYTDNLSSIPSTIDLAIITTDSFPRAGLVSQLATLAEVKYWLLEKVLAPSNAELELIQDITSKSQDAWVNHWFRLPDWFRQLKLSISSSRGRFLQVEVSGGELGLACNATHFMDYIHWLTDAEISAISTDRLATNWEPSKRAGYVEVYGELIVEYQQRASLSMRSDHSQKPVQMKIVWGDNTFNAVFTDTGTMDVSLSGHPDTSYPFPYQSAMTAPVVDSILDTGACNLPSCRSSVITHRRLLKSLTDHWNSVHGEEIQRLRIT